MAARRTVSFEGVSLARDWINVVGAVGLFLLGMTVMTQGLRALAGETLRRLLARFTRSPATGALTGAVTTALVQSSSATTVATVGFVSAGLLTFPQALGVIFGANAGTTLTGWMVAILGFKLRIGMMTYPLVFVGVILHLFAGGRWRHAGWAIAGFGLLFVGIEALQMSMANLEGVVTPEDFPPDTWLGRLALVGIGLVLTLVTQSSSAGMAAALAAIGAGTITFPQAAALVIGMDVGTTFTAALATVGGSAATRRTGFAHVIYNGMTAVMAFFALDLYVVSVEAAVPDMIADNPQTSLVLFHTAFNSVGVLLVLPFADRFAAFMTRLVPDRGPELTRHLGRRPGRDVLAATLSLATTVREIGLAIGGLLLDSVRRPGASEVALRAAPIQRALETARAYASDIRSGPDDEAAHGRLLSAMHVLDHQLRLVHRIEQVGRARVLETDPRLRRLSGVLATELESALDAIRRGRTSESVNRFDRVRRILREQRGTYRQRLLRRAVRSSVGTDETLAQLDALRWLHRVSYHVWRILAHLAVAEGMGAASEEPIDPDGELDEDVRASGEGAGLS